MWAARVRIGPAILLAVLVWAVLPAAASGAFREFDVRFTADEPGDIALIGNTVMSCSTSAACTTARNGGANNNNEFTMVNVDVDATAPGANSSTADLSLPAGSQVLFAGLYWGAISGSATRNKAALKTPATSGYATMTASTLDSSGDSYHAFRDVTALVQDGGNGTYSVADVKTTIAAGQYGGWALVVAYRDPAQPPRNLTVFDGFQSVSTATSPLDIDLSGFRTPPTGTVNTSLGVVAQDGDRASTRRLAAAGAIIPGPARS